MLEDSYKILKVMNSGKKSFDLNELINTVVEGLCRDVVTDYDRILLNLVFAKNPEQKDLDNFLNNWDIEVVGGHKALMLAYFMKMHPSLVYSDYVAPRMRGLLEYYRFKNLKLISHYTRICHELKESGIDFLIFKGGCMKYLRPEFPRVMGDIDILVDEKNYRKSGLIAEKMGYDAEWDIHSIDLHSKGKNDGIMDIHKYIIMESEHEKAIIKDLFKRATKQRVFGIETLVPCNEDLVFILLVNMIRNLRHKTSSKGILYNLFDCKFLIDSKPNFNWDIIIRNSKKTKTECHIFMAIQFINSIVPNLLPEKFEADKHFEKEFRNYCILLIYQRFFLWDMKQKHHLMKFKDLFLSWDSFKKYIRLKPKYFILKLFFIRKNPYLAEKILRKAGLYEN